jgi:hypothetical protein
MLIAPAAVIGIPAFLPEYRPAVVPIVIACIGGTVYALLSGYPNVLGLLASATRLVTLQAAWVAALVPLTAVAARLGLGLPGMALATSMVLIGYGISVAVTAHRETADDHSSHERS